MDRVSIYELESTGDATIVDIRNKYYYNIGHIKGAINIPYYNLLNNYRHYLDKEKLYYLYCDSGDQSNDVAIRLRNFGYNTYSIDGGYLYYKNQFESSF